MNTLTLHCKVHYIVTFTLYTLRITILFQYFTAEISNEGRMENKIIKKWEEGVKLVQRMKHLVWDKKVPKT